MRIAGIIVEYNPMHNGHVYHINKTKELTGCDYVVAVMSGNFNQRGIPSIVDKWTKTKMALLNGVDIVLELPCVYSLSSAEFFSSGAVSLLNSLGIIDSICFGSESGDIKLLDNISEVLTNEPIEFKELLKNHLDTGITFPKARSLALNEYLESHSLWTHEDLEIQLNSSNNILGIEYLKSLKKYQSSIKPYTLHREGGSYNSQTINKASFSSATSIRATIKNHHSFKSIADHVPQSVLEELIRLDSMNYVFADESMIYPYIKYKNAIADKNSLELLPDVSEGLHNKISSSIFNSSDYEQCINLIKSKRYAYTRISRILCQYYLGLQNYNLDAMRRTPCPYARLLGFNQRGTELLKHIKNNSAVPLYSKLPKDKHPILEVDLLATRGYSILNPFIRHNEDLLTSPLRV